MIMPLMMFTLNIGVVGVVWFGGNLVITSSTRVWAGDGVYQLPCHR